MRDFNQRAAQTLPEMFELHEILPKYNLPLKNSTKDGSGIIQPSPDCASQVPASFARERHPGRVGQSHRVYFLVLPSGVVVVLKG